MLITCPSCATHYEMPLSRFAPEGTMIKCASCGHSWLEARAIEVANSPPRQIPTIIEHSPEPDQEIRRLVEASREAEERFISRRNLRRRRVALWSAFFAALMTPLALAAAFPETVVRLAPVAVRAYDAMGRDVNIYGLELRRIEMQYLLVDGAKVLAVKGEIVNISASDRKIPSLRFGLRDATYNEVYKWILDAGARPLHPGESTNFVTRVASPPEAAKDVEIRFAHADEIGSDVVHE